MINNVILLIKGKIINAEDGPAMAALAELGDLIAKFFEKRAA